MENTQTLIFPYPKYDKKIFVPPFIGRVISWEKPDKPVLEYGTYRAFINENRGELILDVKNNDIIEVGQAKRGKGVEGITANLKIVKFEPKPKLYSITMPEARNVFFKTYEYIITPSKQEETKKWISFKGKPIESGKSWKVDTTNTSIAKKTIIKDIKDWSNIVMNNMTIPQTELLGNSIDWIDESVEINQKDFERLERVEKFKARIEKSKAEEKEKLLKEMEFALGKKLKECVQELIAVVGEMIATGKPAPEKIFKISKKLELINKKKEIFLKRSIEI